MIDGLKSELPEYLAEAEDVSEKVVSSGGSPMRMTEDYLAGLAHVDWSCWCSRRQLQPNVYSQCWPMPFLRSENHPWKTTYNFQLRCSITT